MSPYVIRQGFHYSQHHYNQAMIKLFQKQKIFFAKLCFLGHRHVQVLLVFDLDGDFPYNRYFVSCL